MYKALFQTTILSAVLMIATQVFCAEADFGDPTRPLGYTVKPEANSTLRLDSVLISDQRKVAVINGKPIAENQWIQGRQVKEIKKHQVVLFFEGQQIVLSLHKLKTRQ